MGPQKLLMPRARLSFTKEISWNAGREQKKRPVGCLCLAAVTFLVLIPVSNPRLENIEVDANEVKYWALKFGKSIATSGARATCLAKLTENFNYGSKVEWVSANSMLEDMRVDVQHMLSWKQQAVERIVRVAEDYAAKHEYDKHLKYDYFNMKKLYDPSEPPPEDENRDSDWRSFHLEKHHNFDQFKVNPQYSAMHVPTNVYDKDPEVVNAIKWSEYLTTTFRNNLAVDPALTWQFFCSSTGFLRLFPAMKWPQTEGPDLYDCRMRHWYVQTAASAKDVVILLDGSGSMTGLRKEIARNVVFSILDTLSDNDYLSILRFSDIIEPVVPCFENSLVQANEQNIRELKEHLETLDTRNIANFTLGLVTAFEILQKYNRTGQGSQCNQAIMLITDGAPYTYEEIFRQYNWPNIPVRVFTYLIGREVTDIREVNWMACANRGYYTHVATLAEAREQVEKYIPVMSRPIVLSRKHPVLWTAVYAHPATQMLSEWLWEEREQSMMQKILIREKEHHMEQKDSQMVQDGEISNQADNSVSLFKFSNEPLTKVKKKKSVQLMTTVAMPVFHPRNSTVQDAKLLGVAGTDIKVQKIQRLTPAFKLGVNAYAFIITNNGYVLFHPDLRPLFQDLLKPGYSSVDITEVELPNNQLLARELDEILLTIRRNMIDRRLGWETLSVKVHQDNMRRVVTRTNKYYYAPIDKTPFSLAIVLPQPYGNHQLYGHVELKGLSHDYGHIFHGKNWRVHPDWVYCEKPPSEAAQNESPEDYLHRIFKDSISTQNFKWRTSSTAPPIFDQPICNPLFLLLVLLPREKVLKMFGMVTTFVATRSGFMRFEDHQSPEEIANNTERPFYDVHTRAIDELFYKRAVDFYSVNSSAFVYSVPFDAGTKRDPLVTASHAIFVSEGEKKAPVAVVGLQIRHSTFVSEFFKETSKCIHKCRYNCSNERLDCYLLDNNGFIIVSEVHSQTGKFFGEVDYTLFDSMINYGIYNRVHLYDYQAICLDTIAPSGPASILMTPFKMFYSTILWMWGKFALFMLEFNLLSWWGGEWAIASDYYDAYSFSMADMLPNRTRPRPCDKEIDLYEMQPQSAEEPIKGRLSRCHSSGCDKHFIVQQVPYTNLVMLVVYKDCPCVTTPVKLESKEIQHNETLRCLRMKHSMYRKRPVSCINYHPQEKTIKQCGRGSLVCASIPVLLGALLFQLVRWSL
ncbi:voltage-dependent calcium channel subunit alpha-2/delta-3-like [Limulus polyphemus]|uniref:Voltage-dependent calcium channel subunit alpha-2/delta-3-like n=1 Tax=Limulus polyphemus TaxID=6850 RepID=A0ABM1SHU6_LIMPO|nr:voltage-dependent calcium channel subunit alpha-2/delta-3-like [Limulus polyphemus]